MREGLYLGAPPVRIWQGVSRQRLHSMLRGVSAYDQAAGTLPGVPALPALQRFRAPGGANRSADMAMVELYAMDPGLFKQRLERQFAAPRARVPAGQLRPRVPQVS